MKFKPANSADLISAFKKIDEALNKKSKTLKIEILGGASIILLGVRQRATVDIDIAVTADAVEFQKICSGIGIPVDIVTIASTVDLNYCDTVNVFKGKALTVDSVTPKDLLKLKLERFYKQDPEDIYAIIKHEDISFEEFKSIVQDMVPDYTGDARQLILSAQIVVEEIWPEFAEEFNKITKP